MILKQHNDDEILSLTEFAFANKMDISFIEEMPLGIITDHDRSTTYMSSDEVIQTLASHYSLEKSNSQTAGPTQYYNVFGENNRVGVISPHSHNFCSSCNRVRMTVEGRLLLCLGNEHSLDLKPYIRSCNEDNLTLRDAIIRALALKPEQHHFDLEEQPQILRFMSATGG